MEIKKGNEASALVKLEGEIDLTNSHLLKEKLQSLYEEGFKVITLDFSLVTNIGSTGLGKLLLIQKKLKEQGGELKIINVTNEYIRKMFKMIQLSRVINIEGESI